MMYTQDYLFAAMLLTYTMMTEYQSMISFFDYEMGSYS